MKSLKEITPEIVTESVKNLFGKYDFVRALVQTTSGLAVSANLNQTTADPTPLERGVVLTITHNGIVHEASTSISNFSSDIKKLIHGIEKNIASSQFNNGNANLQAEKPEKANFTAGLEAGEVPLSQKIQKAQEIVQSIKEADSAIVMASARFRDTITHEIYVSKERQLSQKISRFEAIFSAILKDQTGAHSAQIYDGFSKQGGWELMSAPQEIIGRMVRDGKKILGAPRLEPGTYECIFAPSMSGMLAHEAFGHGTEADTLVKKRAKGADYMGKPVASPLVRLYDSPALENEAASYFFDHEGCMAAETRIVENGILVRPITDHLSATLLGVPRTPNGRREAYHHKIYTRMTNTYFMPGKDSYENMLASVVDGFLIDRATNGMEDPKSWGIQLEALYAERIKNGKLTGEVYSPVIVTGYVPDILNSITMVSDQMHINGLGMCGKGYKEWVKVTDGGPYLKLRARLA